MLSALAIYFVKGLVLGFCTGIMPGPVVLLVITQTLKGNFRDGCKVALSSFFSNFPIFVLSYLLLAHYSHFNFLIAGISLIGAIFLVYMAYGNWRVPNVEFSRQMRSCSFYKGLLVNFLSPYPYLFWFTIGAPLVLSRTQFPVGSALSFFFGDTLGVFAALFLMAWITKQSKTFLNGQSYYLFLKVSSVALVGFAVSFVLEGIHLLKI